MLIKFKFFWLQPHIKNKDNSCTYPCHKGIRQETLILSFSIRWMWVVHLMPRMLLCQEKNLWYLFNGRLGRLRIHTVRPIVIYDAEAWTLKSKMYTALRTWARNILRQICGPTYKNGYRKITMNQENCNKIKTPDIVIIIEVFRMDWLGHFLRMDGESTEKKLLEGKLEGGSGGKKERPRLRWIENVELDLSNMYVTISRTRALNKREWAFLMREAKA